MSEQRPPGLAACRARPASLVASALQLLGWILVRPSAWHRLVQSIDPTLTDGFCLLYLSRDLFKNPVLRRVLFLGFFVLPLFAVAVEQSLRLLLIAQPQPMTLKFLATEYGLNAAAKLVGMLRIGGIMAIFVSVGAGIVSMIADIIVNELIHQYFHLFMADSKIHSTTPSGFVQSYPGLCIAIFSFCIGFSIYVRLQDASERLHPGAKSVGAAILGLLLSIFFTIIELIVLLRFKLSATKFIACFAVIILSSLIGWNFHLRGYSWRNGFSKCLRFLLIYSLLMFIGSWLGKFVKPGDSVTTLPAAVQVATDGGVRAVITNCLLLLLIAPVVVGEWLGGAGAAAIAGGLAAPLCWLVITVGTEETWGARTLQERVATLALTLGSIVLGLSCSSWQRYLFYPFEAAWNRILLQIDLKVDLSREPRPSSCIRWNSAFWDELQTLRSDGLVEHLVVVMTRWPLIGAELIEQVSAGPQRWAAQAAQLELELEHLEHCCDMSDLTRIHQRLGAMSMQGPGMDALRDFSRLSQDLSAALAQSNPYHHRIALRIVEEHMDRLARDWRLSGELLAVRCLRILYSWRELLVAHQAHCQRTTASQASAYIESPYIIGLPLSEHQHVFVGRTEVGAQIEKLIMRPAAPPLLLYGQRRMGKTSLLRNLRRLLPSSWITLFVDLQALSSAEGHSGFLFQLARAMTSQLSSQYRSVIEPPSLEALRAEPFVLFDVWLDRFAERLRDQCALLLLDEFEQLDIALRAGSLSPHLVLGMLRHVIQHKPRFRILVAGSHTFAEASVWSSYLINARVIKLGCLRREECRQLVEQPVPDFALRYEPAALEEVLSLTGGHPYLLQLLCDRIVEMKNQQKDEVRFLATTQDVAAVVEPALAEASLFFAEMVTNQISSEGHEALKNLARQGRGAEQPPGELRHLDPNAEAQLWNQLACRDLVELTSRGYRFQVELIRRYFDMNHVSWGPPRT